MKKESGIGFDSRLVVMQNVSRDFSCIHHRLVL